jgi:hypothetical protein
MHASSSYAHTRDLSVNIADVIENYVDGVSITSVPTLGYPRYPIWTYIAAGSDNANFNGKLQKSGCPCTDFSKSVTVWTVLLAC